MTPTALVCGHATLDQAGASSVPGGSVFYAARALAALGARVRVVTAAGDDFPREALSGPSIEAAFVRTPATTAFLNAYAADGTRSQRVLAAAPPLRPSDVPAAWREADLLLLAPVLGEVDPAPLRAAVRARVAGLCVQGLVREVGRDGEVVPRRLEPAPASLAGFDAAFVGEDEVRGQPELPALLAGAVPLVAFTHGPRGSEVIEAGRSRRVGIHPAREIDPTGAGDVYAAAFLLALARGDDPLAAARLGAAAASIVVEGRGGETLDRTGEAWDRVGRVPVIDG